MLARYALGMAKPDRRHRVRAIYSSTTGGKLWSPPTVERVELPSKMDIVGCLAVRVQGRSMGG